MPPAYPRRAVPLLLGAELLAGFAEAALATALGWQAYERTGDPLSLGLIGLAEFAPAFLLALPAGTIADRGDRRLVVMLGLLATVAVCGLLAADAAAGDTRAWPLYALACAGGTARAFFQPALTPLLASAVPAAELARAVALASVSWQSATIVGPAAAGLLQSTSAALPYVVAGVSAAAALALVAALPAALGRAHVAGDEDPPSFRDALDGLRLIRRSRALLGAISLDLVAVLFGGATALMPIFASDVLHVGAAGNGLLRAAAGAGAVVVGLALAVRPIRRRVGPSLFTAVALFGVCTIVFGLSREFALSLVALAALAGADMVSVSIRSTLGPLLTPPALRGRVGAVERVFIGASNELGALESGLAAALIGAVPTVVIGGVLSIAAAAVWAWAFPSLRRVDRFEDIEPAALPGARMPAPPDGSRVAP
jgi:MFS family permease